MWVVAGSSCCAQVHWCSQAVRATTAQVRLGRFGNERWWWADDGSGRSEQCRGRWSGRSDVRRCSRAADPIRAAPTSSGQVVLYAPPLLDYSSYGATFTNPAHPQPDLGCTSTAYGMCNVSNCHPQPTEAARPHAGTITFDSPAIMAMGSITPDTNGLYPSAMSMGLHFAGNEMVTFVGQGDSVPAFNETVAYPELLLMSAPQMAGMTPVMVPRTRDLALRWTGGEPDVSLRLNALKIVGPRSARSNAPLIVARHVHRSESRAAGHWNIGGSHGGHGSASHVSGGDSR